MTDFFLVPIFCSLSISYKENKFGVSEFANLEELEKAFTVWIYRNMKSYWVKLVELHILCAVCHIKKMQERFDFTIGFICFLCADMSCLYSLNASCFDPVLHSFDNSYSTMALLYWKTHLTAHQRAASLKHG